jgi:putative peptide zinc metalloprotease protein
MEAVVPATAAPLAEPGLTARDAELGGVIPSRLRVDIIVRRQFFKHEEYYVLKDPLALTYFRLKPEEAYIITLLDGRRSLLEIERRVGARYPNQPRSLTELAAFINQLSLGGLLNQNAGRFVENARRTAGQNFLQVWAKLIGIALFLKFPLVDPSPWLGGLAHRLRFVWTKWFMGAASLLVLWSLGLVIANRADFSGGMLDFFSLGNLPLLYLAIIVTKTLHEFGHATTCRHFGGEVHEMGVCLMFFTPCGYVDASDAWMMRHKRHKLYVTIAGVCTELVIASIAAHLWFFLPDGFARGVAFNIMLVASVNTIIFNANPLMRFDGYYLVSDLLEIPNLRTKSIAYCSYHLQRFLFGYRNRQQEDIFVHEAQGSVFVFYAVAAYAYMLFITYSMTQIFSGLLEPVGLRDVGLSLGAMVQFSFIGFPLMKVIHDALKPGTHIEKVGSAARRLLVLLGLFAGMGAVSVYWPTHFHITQQAVVMAASGEWVSSETGGIVRQVHVRTGQWVEPGQLLMALANPEIETELVITEAELAAARVQFAARDLAAGWAASEGIARAAQGLEVAETAYQRAAARAAQLQLHARVAGFVLTPDPERLVGAYASSLQPILRIGDTRSLRIVIPLTEDQAQLVEPGGRVSGRWFADGRAFKTALQTVARQPAKLPELHMAMLSFFGGPAPSQVLQPQADFHFPLFLATALLESPDHLAVEGLRVRVDITGRATTVAQRVRRWVYAFFNVGGSKSKA